MEIGQKVEIEKLLMDGHTIQTTPIGYSMYPMLVPGRDMVWIEPADVSRLKRGDVALYRREGSILVLHRIWKKEGTSYYFVGDNQAEVEGPLAERQILGKLVGFERKGRYISVKDPLYRFASAVWLWLRPARPVISKMIHKMKLIKDERKDK